MNAVTFNTAISTLDRDLADHYRAFRLVLLAYISAPSRQYVLPLRHHYRRITALELERLSLAECYHFSNWSE